MKSSPALSAPRILIIDDNPAIHQDFRKILGSRGAAQDRLADAESALFGGESATVERDGFRIDSAYQGQEALAMVEKALAENDQFPLAFVDIRMPPGWDGVETLSRIWKRAPDLQAVICTAYSDYSWDDMARVLGKNDNLLILKKPFENVEVLQLAHALTHKWDLTRQARLKMDDLDRMVRQRTEELVTTNRNLQQEIEERARVQDALHASEERFSKAFQASPIGLAIQRSSDRVFVDVNQRFIELSGYTRERLLQNSDQALQLWAAAADSQPFPPEGRLRYHPCVFRRSDGSNRQTVLSVEPLGLGSTPCILLLIEDVTEQLKLETQLRQAQKMEVIGRMSAGVAHEFNNILTIIEGNVSLLQMARPGTINQASVLTQVMQASKRAATFTQQLLAFSRKQVLQPAVVNLSGLVIVAKDMIARLIGDKYEIQLACANDLPAILADESGLEQILINLALNARDAMRGGGRIQIETSLAALDVSAKAKNPDARSSRFVCLSVTDEGCGMTPEVRERIFDPFFTTKDIGKGAGLGLSTIHGIVKQHNGWIEVISQSGRGSTFKVFLPAGNEPNENPAPPACDPLPAAIGNGETVLQNG